MASILLKDAIITNVDQGRGENNAQTSYFVVHDGDGGEFKFNSNAISQGDLLKHARKPVDIRGVVGGKRYERDQVLSFNTIEIVPAGTPFSAPAGVK